MDKVVYISMVGAKQTMHAQAINANNLANISTTGFRADLVTIQTLHDKSIGHDSRSYGRVLHTGVDLSQGTNVSTGRSLDIALSGEGYLAVQSANGQEAYTRAGNLKVSVNGILETIKGAKLIGNSGPITIPEYKKIHIGVDGTISILPIGQQATQLSVVDRIKVVNLDATKLRKNEQGMLVLQPDSPKPVPDTKTRIQSGMLESSNVSAVGALINMIDLARQFEMNVKVIRTEEETDKTLSQLMRLT